MKVEIKESNQVKERPFPKLMTHQSGGIFLMYRMANHNEMEGVCLNSKYWPSGCYRRDWSTSCLTDFEGSITLSNE